MHEPRIFFILQHECHIFTLLAVSIAVTKKKARFFYQLQQDTWTVKSPIYGGFCHAA